MIVELCPSNLTYCSTCQSSICFGSLRVTLRPLLRPGRYSRRTLFFPTKYFHLDCYRPNLTSPIADKDVIMSGIVLETDFVTVRNWVSQWNQQFSYTEASIPEKYTQQSVASREISQKRLLLEVFSYLSVCEIERLAANTCKAWFTVTRADDLWKARYVQEFNPSTTQAGVSYRSQYILIRLKACWSCNSILRPSQIFMRCPYYEMLLCKKCAKLPKCRIVSLNSYSKSRFVKETTARMLGVPIFKHFRANSTYLHVLADIVLPYAEKRRDSLIASLKLSYSGVVSDDVIAEIDEFRLGLFYMQRIAAKSRAERGLAVFCGKNEKKEKFQRSVEEFVQDLGIEKD